MIEFDVYGTRIGVLRTNGGWRAVHIGSDGKTRPADGVTIPPWVTVDELSGFLADLFHEAATPERPDVVRLT